MSGKIEDEDDDLPENTRGMTPKQLNSYLIKRIIDYWAGQGYRVRVWAMPVSTPDPKSMIWEIRSDLKDGLPPRTPSKDGYGRDKRTLSPPLSGTPVLR